MLDLPSGVETFRKGFLPALAVLETIATKGKSPGTTALKQQQIFASEDERRRLAKENALKRQLTEAQLGEFTAKQVSRERESSLRKVLGERTAGVTDPEELQKIFEQTSLEFTPVKFLSEQAKRKAGGRKQKFEAAKFQRDLSNDFSKSKPTQEWDIINSQFKKLNNVWQDYINQDPAKRKTRSMLGIDQAIVIVFNKMLDPGSVVRESEFARTPEAAAALQRIKGWIPKLQRGGIGLTDIDRAEIVRTARLIHGASRQQFAKHARNALDRAMEFEDLGINPKSVIGNEASKLLLQFGSEPEGTTPTPDVPKNIPRPATPAETIIEQLKIKARAGDALAQDTLRQRGVAF